MAANDPIDLSEHVDDLFADDDDPDVKKVAVAVVDESTTSLCLIVHGQVQWPEDPFETLAGDIQSPPFHFFCRTMEDVYVDKLYHIGQMENKAAKEINRRIETKGFDRWQKELERGEKLARPTGKIDAVVKTPAQIAEKTAEKVAEQTIVPSGWKPGVDRDEAQRLSKLLDDLEFRNPGEAKSLVARRTAEKLDGDNLLWREIGYDPDDLLVQEAISKHFPNFWDDFDGDEVAILEQWLKIPNEARQEILEEYVSSHVAQWASTSGDGDELSLAIQLNASKFFGSSDDAVAVLREVAESRWTAIAPRSQQYLDDRWSEVTRLANNLEYAHREIFEAQYKYTQELLENFDELHLYRGFHVNPDALPPRLANLKVGESAEIEFSLQPLSSFSSKEGVAQSFSRGYLDDQGFMIEVTVPRSAVMGCPATGVGCLNEYEWVLTSPPPGAVMKIRKVYQ